MSSLIASLEKVGLITYRSTKGTPIHFSERNISSYTELPDNTLFVITKGGEHRLKFDNATDKDAAKVIFDDALSN